MAIAYDNSVGYVAIGTGVTSISFTVAGGAYLMAAGDGHFSGGTYNGVALSLLFSFSSPILDGNGQTIKVYGLANPTSGSHTFNATGLGTNNSTVCLISYTGMETSIVPENSNSAYSNNGVNNTQVTTLSATVNTLTNNAWTVLFASGGNNPSNAFAAGAGTTLRVTNSGNNLGGAIGILDSNGPISPSGSSTLTANWTSLTGFISLGIFSIKTVSFTPQLLII